MLILDVGIRESFKVHMLIILNAILFASVYSICVYQQWICETPVASLMASTRGAAPLGHVIILWLAALTQ
ncbi:hypothetical protein RRG08_048194, partial [Elysia crispata]